jgi:hypothetical protein
VKSGSQNARLIAVLRDGPATNREIHERAGHMVVNSRCAELRSRGYQIECEYLGGTGAGAYRYWLLSEPTQIGAEPTAGSTNGVPPVPCPGGAARTASVVRADAPAASASPLAAHPAAGAQLSLDEVAA